MRAAVCLLHQRYGGGVAFDLDLVYTNSMKMQKLLFASILAPLVASAEMTTPSSPFQLPTTLVGSSATANLPVYNNSGSSVTIQSASTVFEEDFSSPDALNNWTVYPTGRWCVTNGVAQGQNLVSGDTWVSLMRQSVSDVVVEMDCMMTGIQTHAIGICLRASEGFTSSSGTGLRFQIGPGTQDYLVLYDNNGNHTWIVSSWTYSSAIKTSGMNRLKVVAEGTTATFYINGTKVWSGSVNYSTPGTCAGVFCCAYLSGGKSSPIMDNISIGSSTGGGSDSGLFKVASSFVTPVTIPAYGTCNIPIVFSPTVAGSFTSSVTLGDASGGVTTFPLAGVGVNDALCIDDSNERLFKGHVGQDFAPSQTNVTLRNVQSGTVGWRLHSKPEWLDVSPDSGTLAGGASEKLVIKPSAFARQKDEGDYSSSVVVSNTASGKICTLPVRLSAITSARPEIDASMNVTCLLGQKKTISVPLRNAASSDRPLTAKVTVKDVTNKATAGLASTSAASQKGVAVAAKRPFTLPEGVVFSPSTLLVRFENTAVDPDSSEPAEQSVLKALGGGEVIRRYTLVPGLTLVQLPMPVATRPEMESLVRKFNAARGVVYAQPNYRLSANLAPNDAAYSKLWGMKNNSVAGADIHAEAAWDITTGSDEVIVGVIDTGIDYTHEDLKDNMWINEGEIPGNGIDDDGNGYIDDVYGINAITGTGDPKDDHYHGTHCSGTIGGVGNNGVGVAGVCWKVRLMALKFLNSSGSGNSADAVTCIEYGVTHGCRVLSNSWGGGGYNSALLDMIRAARDAGVLFVVAAGNDGSSIESGSYYPACYDSENILTVAALTSSDALASYSNYGKTMVDIGAPGSDVYSCAPGNSYKSLNGTSMATPHVAGAAALLLARNPNLTYADLKEILMSTAVPISALSGKCVSGGRLNAAAALEACKTWLDVAPLQVEALASGATTNLVFTFDAADFPTGDYAADVTITAQDSEAHSATIRVNCKILEEELVIPDDPELVLTVPEGTDFAALTNSLTIRNAGNETNLWSVASDASWLTFAVTNGTLAGGAEFQLAYSIDSSFTRRIAGEYDASFSFIDHTTGAIQTRTVKVKIVPAVGTIYVDAAAGNDDWHGRTVDSPRRTLQSALYDVVDGQQVSVAAGVYEPIAYFGASHVTLFSSSGPGETVIDGAMRERCVSFISDAQADGDTIVTNVTMRGFTLADGWAFGSVGGAALGGNFENCRFVRSEAAKGGGVARACVTDSEILQNRALTGGGAYACLLNRVRVGENLATGAGEDGGGGGTAGGRATDCYFFRNRATGVGAADDDCSQTALESCSFEDPMDKATCVKVRVAGNGLVSSFSLIPSNGVATVTAVETGRPFSHYEEDGELLTSNRVLTLTGVTSSRSVTAVFDAYDFYVDVANGNADNDGRTPQTPRQSISSVYRDIRAGETIHVAPGTYDPIDSEGRPITIAGAGAEATFIDGKGEDTCATLGTSTNGTTLADVTLLNGAVALGSGAGVRYGAAVGCVISNCTASLAGGGAYGSELTRCVLALNTAAYGGAAAYSWLRNCSVGGNLAYEEGAGTYECFHESTVLAENSGISGDTDDVALAASFEHSLTTADGSLRIVSPRDGDLRLRTGSRLLEEKIGAYDEATVDGYVLRSFTSGHGRVTPSYVVVPHGGIATFTAEESSHVFEHFEVDGAVAGNDMTLSLSNVTADHDVTAVYGAQIFYVDNTDLSAVVDQAESGDIIYVYSGTYGPIDVQGKALLITGLATNGAVVISGAGAARCATLGQYENAPQTTLVNITLEHGYADCGAGAYMGILSNCVIRSCSSSGTLVYGGATYCSQLYDCTLSDNMNKGVSAAGGASYGGLAMRTVFSGNYAGVNGGRHAWGGAVCAMDTESCLFYNNAAQTDDERESETTSYGGAIYGGRHVNATVVDNRATALYSAVGGGAMAAELYNSIVFGNSVHAEEAFDDEADIADLDAFESSTTEDPLFYSVGATGCRLAPLSSVFEMGDDSFVTSATDLDGRPRIQGDCVDLGCFEGAVLPHDVPHMPTIIGASDNEYLGAIRVNWTMQNDAYGFRVYRGLKSNASDAILVGETTSVEFMDASAAGEVLYRYYVTATNNFGESAKSAVVQGSALKTLSILSSALRLGYTGMGYEYQMLGEGGFEPCLWSVAAGSLPDGITLDSSGLLSGTFDESEGEWPVTFAFTDSQGNRVTRAYVLSCVKPDMIGTVLEAPELVWSNDVNFAWTVARGAAAYDSEDCLMVTGVGVKGLSSLKATVTGPGTIVFHWRLDATNESDSLSFAVDGVTERYVAGDTSWEEVSYELGSGTHDLVWNFRGARSSNGGESVAYLDAVSWKADETTQIPTLAESLNDELEWQTDETSPWTVLTGSAAYDGVACAVSAKIGDEASTSVRTVVSGPGKVSFVWRTSCEEGYDWCHFSVNGVRMASRTGETAWGKVTFDLPAATNELVWTYRKDDMDELGKTGQDAAYLDQIEYELDENFQSTKKTDVPVPYQWLRDSGVDLSDGYEKAATAIGANGFAVWESFVAGLDPTNENSKFTAKIEMKDGRPVVTFDPDLGDARTYKTYGKEKLSDEWIYPITDACRYFTVTVEYPTEGSDK